MAAKKADQRPLARSTTTARSKAPAVKVSATGAATAVKAIAAAVKTSAAAKASAAIKSNAGAKNNAGAKANAATKTSAGAKANAGVKSNAALQGAAPSRASQASTTPRKPITAKRPAPSPAQALEMYQVLRERHADAHCELDHRSPFELIVATVLSAQSTDVMVNKITPELFRRWPGPRELAAAPAPEVEQVLSKIGMFRQKAKNIMGLSKLLLERHGGEVPRTLDELVKLPGVGRKTANVVLGVAFGMPEGVVVDTHVQRISQRLGLTRNTEPIEIEQDLMKLFDRSVWDPLSHTLIFHGRRICSALKPACPA